MFVASSLQSDRVSGSGSGRGMDLYDDYELNPAVSTLNSAVSLLSVAAGQAR